MTTKLPIAEGSALEAYRLAAGVSQSEMAEAMRIPLRTYENLAAGPTVVRGIHLRAAQYALMVFADRKQNAKLINVEDQALIVRLAKLIEADR